MGGPPPRRFWGFGVIAGVEVWRDCYIQMFEEQAEIISSDPRVGGESLGSTILFLILPLWAQRGRGEGDSRATGGLARDDMEIYSQLVAICFSLCMLVILAGSSTLPLIAEQAYLTPRCTSCGQLPSMVTTPPRGELNNVSGAIIFVGYVLAALFFTAFLLYDLFTTYASLPTPHKQNIHAKLQIFSALAILSFAVLSYHMLSYLIVSYQAWATARDVTLPSTVFGRNGVLDAHGQVIELHIWTWLKTSILFQDSARTICGTSARFWWTGPALLMTMRWSVFMSIEGRRRDIPHLWAYALRSQILPVSFAQNLFFVALLLQPVLHVANNTVQLLPEKPMVPGILIYIWLLYLAPTSSETPSTTFMLIVLGIRLLLFYPLLLDKLSPLGSLYRRAHSSDQAHDAVYWTYLLLLGLIVIEMTRLPPVSGGPDDGDTFYFAPKAVNHNPSVSALGYDFLFALISGEIWRNR